MTFDFTRYMELAQRTAKQEDNPRGDIGATLATLDVLVAAGALADLLKRQIFYRRAATAEMFALCIEDIRTAINALEESIQVSVNQDDALPINARILHGSIGTIGEEAEMLSALRRRLGDAEMIDEVNVIEEAGDALWYQVEKLVGVEQVTGANVADVCAVNIAKLAARYGSAFSDHAALNRNLDVERKVMEGEA